MAGPKNDDRDDGPGPLGRRGLGRPRAQSFGSGLHVDNAGATIGTQLTGEVVNLGSLVVTMPNSSPASSPKREPEAPRPITIALFSANATLSGHHLQLEEEMAAIGEALRTARFRDRYALRLCPAATFDRLLGELDEVRPQVVHICGHADSDGCIALKRGSSQYAVAPAELAELFAALDQPPRLVVFASCNSYLTAKAVVGTVEHAIGFEGEVHDETAAAFGRSLYERLASRVELEVPRAFRLAKLAAITAGYQDAERARLLSDIDATE